MNQRLIKASFSLLLIIGIAIVGSFSFSLPAQATQIETEQYFIKEIKKNQVLSVSPNFRGELTQASLLPSLTEISETYHIRATKAIQAEKLNGKQVPGLIVYVEAKPSLFSGAVANKP